MGTIFYVTAPGERPAFYLMQQFVWGGEGLTNFDTDGNSYPADSTTWTELTVITRDGRKDRFDVDPVQVDPLILKVVSDSRNIAARAAYALAVYTGGTVGESASGPFKLPDSLIPAMGETFDLEAALRGNSWLRAPQDQPPTT